MPKSWGPNKIRQVLSRSDWKGQVPSESTFKRVLDKAGLVRHRRQRKAQEQGVDLGAEHAWAAADVAETQQDIEAS